MKKSIGTKSKIFPLPVLIVGTYDAEGKPNAMNVAWGGQCGPNHIALNLGEHNSTDNLRARKEFTCALADVSNLVASDYVGIVSLNKDPQKMEKSGLHASKAEIVDAPVFDEFKVTMECRVVSMEVDAIGEIHVIGEVVNTLVEEDYLTEDGKLKIDEMQLISFDPDSLGYRVLGERVGNAFGDGKQLM